MLGLALVAALAIDSARLHGTGFFRIAIFLPYAVPGRRRGAHVGLHLRRPASAWPATSTTRSASTVLDAALARSWILASIGNIVTWEFVGYNMLIFYSALRVIPAELYEAAEIDGAGPFRVITGIKLPALRGAIVIATIFSIIGSFQLFNEPNILQTLAPNVDHAPTSRPNMYAYNLSFAGQQYNYSATVAIVMGVITAVIAYVVQLRGTRKEDAMSATAPHPESAPPTSRARRRTAHRRGAAARAAATSPPRPPQVGRVLTLAHGALRDLQRSCRSLWLVINATKTQSGLFSSFGLWFGGDFALFAEHRRDAHLPRRHLPPLVRQHAALRGRRRGRRHAARDARRLRRWRSSTSRAGARSSRSCSARSRCPARRSRCRRS